MNAIDRKRLMQRRTSNGCAASAASDNRVNACDLDQFVPNLQNARLSSAPEISCVSVVIPNFNHGRLIPRAIAALLRQVRAPLEIIVVDDGSSDDSIAVIERLRRQSPSIRLIRHATNLGAPAALNTGLRAARGTFVYFAAADDFCLPNLFSKALAALEANPSAAFYCANTVLVDPSGQIIGFRPFMWPAGKAAYISPDAVRRELAISDNWAVGATVVFRRQRLLAIGGFGETLASLCDGMVVRLLALVDGFYFDPSICAAWEVYPESLSARSALSSSESSRLADKLVQHVKSAFPADVRDTYALLWSRRLRFNMGRLWLVFGKGVIDGDQLSAALQLSALDNRVLRLLAALPGLSKLAILAWLTVRLRPYGVRAIVKGWWRARVLERNERRAVERAIAIARGAIDSPVMRLPRA